MLSVEEARQQMLNTIPVLPTEKREILNCAGYVLAEALHAEENIPPFDNSAMDGYAVRAADVQNASKEKPAVLSQSCGDNCRRICPNKTGCNRASVAYHDGRDDA